jgi:hypothetical protein
MIRLISDMLKKALIKNNGSGFPMSLSEERSF